MEEFGSEFETNEILLYLSNNESNLTSLSDNSRHFVNLSTNRGVNDDNEAVVNFSLSSDDGAGFVQLEDFLGFSHDVPELPNSISGKIITGFTIYDAVMIFVILIFISYLKDKKIKAERQPIFIPRRPPKGFRKYAVLVETGQSPAGGTTSGVFIRLCGKLTKSPAFSLSWPTVDRSRQLFWSQNKDMFILSVPHYLGHIDAIEVMTDRCGDSPPWFLRSVRVMCLDNRKCWKSKINAWLRGNQIPFSFKSNVIGALSTREYMKKVFLQNHSWTTMWYRALGSSFTCSQRCVIQWTSFAVAMFVAHFFLYEWPYNKAAQVDEPTGLRIPLEHIIRGDDAVSAGILASVAGAIIGAFLRAGVRKCTSAARWARVDDKDDFGHVMNPEDLTFTDGAVIIANRPVYSGPKFPPYPPCIDDSVLKVLDTLSPEQVGAMKQMVDCNKPTCDMKTMMETKTCCHMNDNDISCTKSRESDEVEQLPSGIQDDKNLTDGSVLDGELDLMDANKRGYKKVVAEEMNALWGTPWTGLLPPNEQTRKEPTSSYGGKKIFNDLKKAKSPTPRAGHVDSAANEMQHIKKRGGQMRNKKKNKVRFGTRDQVPSISARVSDSFALEEESVMKNGSEVNVVLPEDYDSLSDPESDEEMVTKSLRNDHEVNLRRRPHEVYDGAPWWDDRHRVYVSAPEAGNMHYQAVNERYERTADPETACCKVRAEATFGEDAILNYLDDGDRDGEDISSAGGIVEQNDVAATAICGFALLAAMALSPYIAYARLPLPNAHALYYLYSVILCLVFHATVFCTTDGVFCALLATWARRRRIARARIPKNEDDEETTDVD